MLSEKSYAKVGEWHAVTTMQCYYSNEEAFMASHRGAEVLRYIHTNKLLHQEPLP